MAKARSSPVARSQLQDLRWQSVLDTARDAIISIDASGLVTLFNRGAQEMFGYRAEEVVGKNIALLMPSPYRDEHDTYLANYRRTGVPQAIGRIRQVSAQRRNGEVFPIELSVSEARADGDVLYTAIIRDVSERHAANDALLALQRTTQQKERLADIGAITAQIAHDLGNPLAAVSMQAQLILRRIQRDEAQPVSTVLRSVEQIVAEVGRLTSLIREFLEFSREQRLSPSEIVVDDLLNAVADTWRAFAHQRNVTLRVDTAPRLPPLRADLDKLRRVLDNLVRNGVEAIEGRGWVTLTARLADSNTLRLTVEDSGSGISENVDVFRLFETTKSHGTGLGLPIAKQIVQAHGGRIEYAHVEPHGTVFVIELPSNGPALPGSAGSADRG